MTDDTVRAARAIGAPILVATIVGCGLSLTIALLAVRLDQAGFSARAIGLNTAAGGVATLLSAPLVPWAARRVGVAALLAASLILGGVALLGFTLTADYSAWLVLRFVTGVSVTVMFILSEVWITAGARPGRGGLAISIYVTALAAGFAAGPLLLGLTGTAGDLPFYLGAGLFVGAAAPLAFTARDAPRLETRSRTNVLGFLREAPAPTLAALLHGAIEVGCLALLPVYALRSSLTPGQGALFASLFVLGGSVLQLPIGVLADRFDRRRLLVALAAAGGAAAIVLAQMGAAAPLAFEIALLIWGGIVGALYPVSLGLLGTLYRDADLAGANAANVMAYAVGMLIGPPLLGAGMDLVQPGGLFWAIAALCLLYLAVATPLLWRVGRMRASSAAAARPPHSGSG
jgi:MFS family permease